MQHNYVSLGDAKEYEHYILASLFFNHHVTIIATEKPEWIKPTLLAIAPEITRTKKEDGSDTPAYESSLQDIAIPVHERNREQLFSIEQEEQQHKKYTHITYFVASKPIEIHKLHAQGSLITPQQIESMPYMSLQDKENLEAYLREQNKKVRTQQKATPTKLHQINRFDAYITNDLSAAIRAAKTVNQQGITLGANTRYNQPDILLNAQNINGNKKYLAVCDTSETLYDFLKQ
ncbi:MAG: hypothetical protein ACMXYD_04500 [Candidatus Woesearchaeota archaeon]